MNNKILIDEKIYPLNIVKRAIYKNLAFASFFLTFEKKGVFKILIKRKSNKFDINSFFDDLNYYNFLEEESKRTQPIFDDIITQLKKA